ncbi:hypothetical protein CC80DRAFT_264706 [Byssothecium circinans]|uniref:Uncharacterized protein n=1 Tax=Byssothecium circinans TaxID=147558 RepID=A0A6A5U7Z8_9PLEO|nr:hypothetical protein CC80DRAFT_264706 [Byssothecium circinans]
MCHCNYKLPSLTSATHSLQNKEEESMITAISSASSSSSSSSSSRSSSTAVDTAPTRLSSAPSPSVLSAATRYSYQSNRVHRDHKRVDFANDSTTAYLQQFRSLLNDASPEGNRLASATGRVAGQDPILRLGSGERLEMEKPSRGRRLGKKMIEIREMSRLMLGADHGFDFGFGDADAGPCETSNFHNYQQQQQHSSSLEAFSIPSRSENAYFHTNNNSNTNVNAILATDRRMGLDMDVDMDSTGFQFQIQQQQQQQQSSSSDYIMRSYGNGGEQRCSSIWKGGWGGRKPERKDGYAQGVKAEKRMSWGRQIANRLKRSRGLSAGGGTVM